MVYEKITIPLGRLRLNKDNDRHGPLESEQACIQWMLNNLGNQISNLAKDIAEHGLSPIEGVLVFPDQNLPGDYVVWEGNRRLTALKLLDDPDRCHDPKPRRKFLDIRKKAKADIPDELECTVAPSIEDADRLIELRHQGPQDGVGTLQWDGSQKSRHLQRLGKKGRYAFSQQVIDTVIDKLPQELREKVNSPGFAISTLDRLLGNPDVRLFLGIANEDGIARRFLRESETLKGIKKVLEDIGNGMPVKRVYLAKEQRAYLKSFRRIETPDKNKTLKDSVQLAPPKPGPRPPFMRSKPPSHHRPYLIPTDIKYRIHDTRLNKIYIELKKLDVVEYSNAVSVLFRVFLELSVDIYLEHYNIPYKKTDSFSAKTAKAINHLKTNHWLDRNSAKGINTAIASKHNSFSIDTFHAYVHNRQFHPSPTELKTAWDNVQPFFNAVFSHLD